MAASHPPNRRGRARRARGVRRGPSEAARSAAGAGLVAGAGTRLVSGVVAVVVIGGAEPSGPPRSTIGVEPFSRAAVGLGRTTRARSPGRHGGRRDTRGEGWLLWPAVPDALRELGEASAAAPAAARPARPVGAGGGRGRGRGPARRCGRCRPSRRSSLRDPVLYLMLADHVAAGDGYSYGYEADQGVTAYYPPGYPLAAGRGRGWSGALLPGTCRPSTWPSGSTWCCRWPPSAWCSCWAGGWPGPAVGLVAAAHLGRCGRTWCSTAASC